MTRTDSKYQNYDINFSNLKLFEKSPTHKI